MRLSQKHMYHRFNPIFLVLCVLAIGCLCAAIAIPYWYNVGKSVHYTTDEYIVEKGGRYLVYQGLWSDYRCKDVENVTDCEIYWHIDYSGGDALHVMPRLKTLRGLELAALCAGVVSLLGLIFLMRTCNNLDWRKNTSQVVFSGFSLLAGFLAIMGVLIVVGTVAPATLHWALALPTISAFFWLFNGSMSFVVCRYDTQFEPKQYATMEESWNKQVEQTRERD